MTKGLQMKLNAIRFTLQKHAKFDVFWRGDIAKRQQSSEVKIITVAPKKEKSECEILLKLVLVQNSPKNGIT